MKEGLKGSAVVRFSVVLVLGAVLAPGVWVAAGAAQMADISLRDAPRRGPEEAPVTILAFSAFDCEPCSSAAIVLQAVYEQYGTDVRVFFKHAPPESNATALLAHEAALAAGAQGRFWEMHDLLVANKDTLQRHDLVGMARQLELDEALFAADLDSGRFRAEIEADRQDAIQADITIRPTFFLNGRRLEGPQTLTRWRSLIEEELRSP